MGLALLLGTVLSLQWPAVPPPTPGTDGVHDAVVIAGTSDLVFLPDIAGAADSATDWYRHFIARGVPVDRVHLLRNAEVTREQLLEVTQQAASQVSPEGTLWLIFIGHGTTSWVGAEPDGLLVGADAQATERSLLARSVAQKEWFAAAVGRQRRTIAVVDACFSTPLVPDAQATLPIRPVDPGAGRFVYSASAMTAGPLPGHDRPALSYLLLGALSGWGDDDGDGAVTAEEAFSFAATTITTTVRTRTQLPARRGQIDDPVLVRGVTAKAPDLDQIIAALPTSLVPPAPRYGPSAPPPSPPSSSSASSSGAQAAFRAREIKLSADRLWVRGDYATPLSDEDLIDAGGDGAPKAAKALTDINFREGSQTLIWVLPPIGGLVVGAGLGVLVGGLYAASDVENADRGWIFGPFIGTFAGASLGAIAVSLPLDAWARIDDGDKQRREHARAELAHAANTVERQKVGLVGDSEAP